MSLFSVIYVAAETTIATRMRNIMNLGSKTLTGFGSGKYITSV